NLGTGDVLDGTDGFVVDIIPPTLAITTDDLALATGETANITFTFSEAVTGFDVSDIAVVGGIPPLRTHHHGGFSFVY
ncbi:Ig-like domain-containing protein, partial [Acinetobacter baumannii]